MEQFLKVDYKLLMTDKVLTKNGTEVSLTMNTKILYALMYDRFLFFSSSNQEYFDTTAYLAARLNVTPKTIEKSIQILEDVGLVVRRKIIFNNLPKNIYNEVKPFSCARVATREVGVTSREDNPYNLVEDERNSCPF